MFTIEDNAPKDNNGTDLPEVVRNICPDYEVIFSHQRLDDKHMNFLYNMEIYKSTLSNEGFGLGKF